MALKDLPEYEMSGKVLACLARSSKLLSDSRKKNNLSVLVLQKEKSAERE